MKRQPRVTRRSNILAGPNLDEVQRVTACLFQAEQDEVNT